MTATVRIMVHIFTRCCSIIIKFLIYRPFFFQPAFVNDEVATDITTPTGDFITSLRFLEKYDVFFTSKY